MCNTSTEDAGGEVEEIRVLDAMCGAGVRALRYLEEGKASFVHANDANDDKVSCLSTRLLRDAVILWADTTGGTVSGLQQHENAT
eukprot:3731507-Rhodomonas_salina.1